ncbi:hypothetical protein PILCRDRAFT_87828 [Piloderma croceum F 1598]|uniref:Uncharacterized protein n=1 Tax=Piloderma croceum (strain F 1598) TaxID=765440 RepID=A0A0C3FWA8_PILCF|nr:hypothetical protein PILCRDRAFT_87828 [Piloderma croceum F 1598]
MITNRDNEEDPNIMYGDILMKFFPRAPAAEGPIYFPTWRDSSSVPQTGERLTSQINTDRGKLKTKLEGLRSKGLVRAKSCDPPEEIPPVSPSMPPLEPIVVDIEELPMTCDNRQAKRRKVQAEKLPWPPTRCNLNKEAMKCKHLARVLEFEEGEVSEGEYTQLSTPITVKKLFTSVQELNEAPTPETESNQDLGYIWGYIILYKTYGM